MGPIGMQEMIGLFVIALLLFGPKKLPELGRTLGKALTEFRRAKNELKNTFEAHMHELEKETRIEPVKEFAPTSYSYPYDDYGRYEEPVGEIAAPAAAQLEQPHLDYPAHDHPNHQDRSLESHALPADPAPAPPPAVPGTVARNNGIQPATLVADQEHSS